MPPCAGHSKQRIHKTFVWTSRSYAERRLFLMENVSKLLRALFQSESSYRRAEQWWADFWARLPGSKHWQSPWLKTAFADGTPMLDGSGILSGKHPEMGRAFQITQEQDEGIRGRVTWWKQTWDPDYENLALLVIVIVPSQEALDVVADLLSAWAQGEEVDDAGDRRWTDG